MTAFNRMEFLPRRRRFRRKAVVFSFSCALAALVVGGMVFFFLNMYLPLQQLQETNHETLYRVHCDAQTCDVAGIANAWDFDASDYVIDKDTYFVLSAGLPAAGFRGFVLHRSDPAFVSRFQQPSSFPAPSGETWRLRSAIRQAGSRQVAVMVGYAEKASWKMALPGPPNGIVDQELENQLKGIAGALRENNGQVELSRTARSKINADGYEIVDLSNDEILDWGYWIPVYLPRDRPLPRDGTSLYRDRGDLYLVRTDANDRVLAVSTELIGDVRLLATLAGLLFLVSALVAYVCANTLLRKYLLLLRVRPHTLDEALKQGEGPSIEFKRSISFEIANSIDEVLRTVTAFANTRDGTMFIGVEDDGKIKGIDVRVPKEKDHLSQRIHQLVRQRIKPSPLAQVDFTDARGFVICRVFVPRGDEPLYFFEGVIYVRDGSSDLKAHAEIVKKLLAEYAF
jgi:hypothetical protein